MNARQWIEQYVNESVGPIDAMAYTEVINIEKLLEKMQYEIAKQKRGIENPERRNRGEI